MGVLYHHTEASQLRKTPRFNAHRWRICYSRAPPSARNDVSGGASSRTTRSNAKPFLGGGFAPGVERLRSLAARPRFDQRPTR